MAAYKQIYLKILEWFCNKTGKDSMEYRIERFRLGGAKIGEGVRAFSPITSGEPYLISVGDHTTLSTGVKFITHDNAIIKCSNGTDLVGSISIGKNCFIGLNAVILPGVSIANNCIVGAGSVVTKSVLEEGAVVAGNPAKKICTVADYASKNSDYVFDFSGVSKPRRRKIIMENQNKWLDSKKR